MTEVLHAGQYFGTRLGARDDGAFSLQLTRYEAGELLPVHTHELPYVCFVLEGSYTERLGSDERACSAGMVITHCGGAPHSDRFGSSGGVCLNVAWNADGGAELVRRSGRTLPTGAWQASRIAALGTELADATLSRSHPRDDFVRARMHELAEELAGTVSDSESPAHEPDWMQEIEQRIEEGLDAELDIASLARAAGVHRTTLLRAFWRHRGSSVSEAIRKKRLERAISAITATRVSLAEVAHLAGYADQSHLCRTLREAAGTSPARLRRHASNGGNASCVQEPPAHAT